MQDPNEDTEWNDILRAKGILPQKEKEITEDEIVNILEETIASKQSGKQMADMNLDELDELEDSEDEEILLEYRRKRIAEMQALASKEKFGRVLEISAQDYVREINKAGDGVWVVLLLYKSGLPVCALINQYMQILSNKFRTVKFVKAVASTCIPNFPERNLPAVFVYFEGDLKKQMFGHLELKGPNLSAEEFEYLIGKTGAINTDIKENPRPQIVDKMFSDLADTNDW